jgi:hypothetical protein
MKRIAFALVFVLMAAVALPAVTQQSLQDYISCLIDTGTDTATVEQPIVPISGICQFLGLNITLETEMCSECVDSTMQNLPSGDPGAFGAIPACFAGTGVRYSHQGQPGLLILSKRPLKSVEVTSFDTAKIRRVNVYATVSGVRFAFTHWPTNYLFDIDPSLGPAQAGALQPDLAKDVIAHGAGVVLGDFNSGPDYQPDGYNLLVNNGYRPLFSQPTYCPQDHASFPPCANVNAKPTSIDNIFLMQNTGFCLKGTFADQPVSDHIGLASLCVLKTQQNPPEEEPKESESPSTEERESSFTIMTIGTWNTMLEPWLPYENQVDAVLAKANLDLLVLEAVWTPAARDQILATVKTKYPHFYYTQAAQQPASCPFTP